MTGTRPAGEPASRFSGRTDGRGAGTTSTATEAVPGPSSSSTLPSLPSASWFGARGTAGTGSGGGSPSTMPRPSGSRDTRQSPGYFRARSRSAARSGTAHLYDVGHQRALSARSLPNRRGFKHHHRLRADGIISLQLASRWSLTSPSARRHQCSSEGCLHRCLENHRRSGRRHHDPVGREPHHRDGKYRADGRAEYDHADAGASFSKPADRRSS